MAGCLEISVAIGVAIGESRRVEESRGGSRSDRHEDVIVGAAKMLQPCLFHLSRQPASKHLIPFVLVGIPSGNSRKLVVL